LDNTEEHNVDSVFLTLTIPQFIFVWAYYNLPNALLRCEQRNTKASANHLKHKTQRIAKMPSVANHS
ncbi:hypothetical protein, partial [Vibrio parahaemolyticus]|uniref:hypothetical protein n=1 Tax=Vibrio parahaemolyticus TaxID=670 RepID=UPI002E2F3C3F